jgi:hypothetical protein
MSIIQLELPPDLEQFVAAEAKIQGHAHIDTFVVEVLRRLKAKANLEADLLTGLDQLDRGEGTELSKDDWAALQAAHGERHGIRNQT